MTKPAASSDSPPSLASSGGLTVRGSWLENNPWLTFVLPLAVYMLAGMLEPTGGKPRDLWLLSIDPAAYPLLYGIKIALTMVAMALVWPGYRQFPFRLSPWGLLVGAVGVVIWIGLCKLELEQAVAGPLGLGDYFKSDQRSAFNPWDRWPDSPLLAAGFLAVRFWGLAVIVPLIEEFFLRGFLMRYFVAAEWWKVPFGTLTPVAVAVGTVAPILMHPPNEWLATAVWFTLVTWLMFKTRNIWDCVAAHLVTNLLLGIYVLATGEWSFW